MDGFLSGNLDLSESQKQDVNKGFRYTEFSGQTRRWRPLTPMENPNSIFEVAVCRVICRFWPKTQVKSGYHPVKESKSD